MPATTGTWVWWYDNTITSTIATTPTWSRSATTATTTSDNYCIPTWVRCSNPELQWVTAAERAQAVYSASYYPARMRAGVRPAMTEEEEAEFKLRRQEQMAASVAAASERMAREEESLKVRHAANKRAEELLLEHLTIEQRKTYKENKWFIVEGGKSGVKYRIRHNNGSVVGNVDVYDGERITHRLCAHVPTDKVPHADNLLAQKMMLQFDEDSFIRTANVHR